MSNPHALQKVRKFLVPARERGTVKEIYWINSSLRRAERFTS